MGSNTELTFAREAAVTSPREARGRDSGLESAEMSDASAVTSRHVGTSYTVQRLVLGVMLVQWPVITLHWLLVQCHDVA